MHIFCILWAFCVDSTSCAKNLQRDNPFFFFENSGMQVQATLNPFTATGYFDIPPPRWPTFLAMLFPILKEGMGLSLLDEFEVQYHVIKK